MAKKIIILTVPGIGSKEAGYSEGLKEKLRKSTKGKPVFDNMIFMETLPFKEAKIDKNQTDLYKRLNEMNRLGGKLSLRKFVLEAFGDAVAFERNSYDNNSPYKRIHRYLRKRIEQANTEMEKYDKARIVIVAASMGVQVLSTYIWDADHKKGIFEKAGATKENNLENLSYLATIGCNIPLFVSGSSENEIQAFKKRNSGFKWDNYYDSDDVLGWPLKQLSDSYKKIVTDHEINTGLYVGAHLRYWDDNEFTKPFAKKIINLYDSM